MPEPIFNGTGVLYHVTPTEHIDSIDGEGIDPSYSRGKLKASWYVNKQNIQWAILHVSLKYNVPVRDITVCATLIDWEHMRRTCQPGRYFTQHLYHPESFTPASFFIEN